MKTFKKYIKPIIWVVTILLVLSGLGSLLDVRSTFSNTGKYAFKLNGKKIDMIDFERIRSNYANQLNSSGFQNVDSNIISLLAFDEVINKNLGLDMANKANIKISKSEIDQIYKEREDLIVNQGGVFKEWLTINGYATKDEYREEIENDLKLEKFLQKLREDTADPTDEQIKKFYEEDPNLKFSGETLEKFREAIVTNIKQTEAMTNYFILLEKAKKSVKLTDINSNYEGFVEKEAMNEDGYSISNVALAKFALRFWPYVNGDKDKADEQAREIYKKQINLVKIAKENGITVNENLPLDGQMAEYQIGYFNKIKSEINPTDAQLEEYFKTNKASYDTQASADAEISVLDIDFSEEDKQNTKKKASELLKKVTVDNFKEMAKENSQDGTASVGGELGWFNREQMEIPFSDAVFSGEPGKIFPNIVSTKYGEHIIYVEEINKEENKARASHIILLPTLSAKTLDNAKKEIDDMIKKISDGDAELLKLKEINPRVNSGVFTGITTDGYITNAPSAGNLKELSDEIYKADLNNVSYKIIGNRCFIFKKINEIKFKDGNFDELKEKIKYDYINIEAQKELEKLF
ncbi:MAG: peptidylprolyl isomerase [Fusobacteriaceae bacterium]|jgi:peptidyl-prolyl cis-trans isomerase D|nr:peptidylprolyl isomerase [Fusobacteriaceae bacterium]